MPLGTTPVTPITTIGGSTHLPPKPLPLPAKRPSSEQWNDDVKKRWNDDYIKQQSSVVTPEQLHAIDKNINDSAYKSELSIDQSSVSESLGAMVDVFKKHNDFYMLGNKLEEKSYTPDKSWIETVSKFENASDLAQSSGAPINSEVKISKTKSYAEFTDLVNKLKNDAKVDEHIRNTIGTGLQTTATLAGALTGLETAAAVVMPWTAGAFVAKTARTVNALDSALAAEKVIQSQRTIAMVANLGVSAAIPVIESTIHEDYTLADGLTSFVLGAGFNQWQLSKIYNQAGVDIRESISAYKAKEVLDGLTPLPLALPAPAQQLALPNILGGTSQFWSKEENVIYQGMRGTGEGVIHAPENAAMIMKGAKSGVFEGITAKIETTIGSLTKELDSITKRLGNTRLGKALRESTLARKEVIETSLKELQTTHVAFKKATSLGNKYKQIGKLSSTFPHLFKEGDDVLATTVSGHIDEGVATLEKTMHPEDLKEFVDEVVKSAGGVKMTIKMTKDGVVAGVTTASGKFKAFAKNNKMKTLIGASVLTSAGAMADDGSGSFASDLPKYALSAFVLYFLGVPAAKAVINNGITKSLSSSFKAITSVVGNAELASTPAGQHVGKMYSLYNASMIAMGYTYKTIFYKGTNAGKKLANDLFWDIDNPSSTTVAEVLKKRALEKIEATFYGVYNGAYKTYAKEMKKTANTTTGKFFADAEVKTSFNQLISDAIENPSMIVHPAVKSVALTASILLKDINQRAIESGTKGFNSKNVIENYLTQVTKYDTIHQIVLGSDGGWAKGGVGYEAVRQQFKNMYESFHLGKEGYKASELDAISYEIMDDIARANNSGIRGNVGDQLGDTIGNAKRRKEFDKTAFTTFNLKVNGVDVPVKLGDIFERDIETLLTGYSNAMEGHIALARKGYSSYTDALNIAGQEIGDVKRMATIGINQLIGRANYDTSSTLATVMRGLGSLSPAVLMPLSAIMQIKEGGSTLIRSLKNWEHFKTATSELTNVLRGRGSDDAYVTWMMELVGQGQTMLANKLHSRLFDDSAIVTESASGSIAGNFAAKSARARDIAMIAYGVAPITDLGQRMNAILNMDLLTKIAHGTKRLTKTEMESYGLTPEILTKVKSKLTLNSKGHLSESSRKALEADPAMYEEIGGVVFNMGQTQMLSPMIGSSPAMFHESALGAAMGNLSSFAFNAYSTYGTASVKGMSRGEPSSYFDLAIWFGSMYAVQEIKDGLKGKERTEQEKVNAALLQIPFAAPASLIGIVTKPVITSAPDMLSKGVASQMASLSDIMGGGIDE